LYLDVSKKRSVYKDLERQFLALKVYYFTKVMPDESFLVFLSSVFWPINKPNPFEVDKQLLQPNNYISA